MRRRSQPSPPVWKRRAARGTIEGAGQLRPQPTQMEVLQFVVEGRSKAGIGAQLGLSARTIEKHVEHIFDKMGVRSRTGIARIVSLTMRGRTRKR